MTCVQLSLPGSPFSLKALNLRRGEVGCKGMFVQLASLLFSLRRCLQTRAALHAENLALRFLCCSACTNTIACGCDLATDLSGSGSPEVGPIGAPPYAL